MNKIFRLYNQNRHIFWIVIVVFVMIVIIIQILNNLVIESKKDKMQSNIIIDEKLYENKMDINEQISNEQIEENKELIIDQFIKYCNAQEATLAYDLLSDDCKEEIFQSIDIFKTNYLSLNFNEQKLYSKEKYMGNTYEVKLYDNILNTGNMSSGIYQDYYTIVEQGNDKKLNISNYVGRKNLNYIAQNQEIQVEVVKKDIYMEYEVYELKIKNLTQNTIIMDTKKKTNTMYLLNKDNVPYYAAGYEVLDSNLCIKPKATNIFDIKYIKELKTRDANKLVFKDVIVEYIENTDKDIYDKCTIEINI